VVVAFDVEAVEVEMRGHPADPVVAFVDVDLATAVQECRGGHKPHRA
jgi:hypothetical protein